MRCRKFQKRLDQLNYAGDQQALPKELIDHLEHCADCSEFAKASVIITDAVSSESKDYEQAVMPIEDRIAMVTSRSKRPAIKESLLNRLLTAVENLSWGRGRQRIAISTVAVMLALFSIVPFNYDQVVGYNLSLAGICPEVAADDETICDLLLSLGIEQASVDLLECDTSCSMMLLDLKSEAEIELAMYAMADLGTEAEVTSVDQIIDRRSASLLQQASDRFFSN